MLYELGYVGCSLIVLIIIAYRFYHYKRVFTLKNVFFGFLIGMGILEIAFDIFSSVAISFCKFIPMFIVEFFSQFFYLFQFLMPFFTYLFVFILTDKPEKYAKVIIWSLIPLFVSLIFWILNPFVHTLFYFDANQIYHRADLNFVVYFSAAFYLVSTGIVSKILKKEIGNKPSNIMFIDCIVCIIVVGIQLFYESILLTGVGIMVSILLMYLYLHNSDSLTDPLTDCFERSALNQYLDGGLVSKEKGYGIAVSLASFKNINTVYGAEVGDEILKMVGHYLLDVSLSHQTVAYRIMGDIFFIPFSNKKDYLEALNMIKTKRNNVFNINNHKIDVKIIIFKLEEIDYRDKNSDLTSLIEFAIEEAKKDIYADEILLDYKFKEKYNYNIAIEQYLHEAIENKLFYMEYQPIWSTKEEKFTMLESLVRLNHPVYGKIPPDIFISVAEKYGMVSDITNIILDMVCDFISRNNPQKYGIKNIKINISAMDLLDVSLINRIEKVLNKYNIDNKLIGFEITETAATHLTDEVNNFLKYCKNKEINLSMDDFGSGYANLDNVMKIDFEVIKLDRSMLLAIDETVMGKDIYRTISKLFQKLDKKIIAEGAETKEQVALLNKWDIDFIQGYYYSKPLSEKDILNLLKTLN